MKVRITQNCFIATYPAFSTGELHVLPDELALALIERGQAEAVKETKPVKGSKSSDKDA